MEANFSVRLRNVLVMEGGFKSDPSDYADSTSGGITEATLATP